MAGNSFKRALVISGCYVFLLAVLLVGLTFARYQDAKVAYTSFGASSFNALILGENTIEGMTDAENPVVNKFGVNLQTVNYRPGMLWSENPNLCTAGALPFSVTNGTTGADSSQVSVEYSVRLRTSGNLPLKYTLALWVPDELESGGGHYGYYVADQPQMVTDENDHTGTWYEHRFYPQGTDFSGSSTELPPEALFELEGGSLQLQSYQLILEWPVVPGGEIGTDTNSPAYMKEVELIEILVTVSSKNMLDEEGYLDTEIPETNLAYSTGLIILDPDKGIIIDGGGACTGYSYIIDYRSFSQDGEAARSFTFRVENGVGKATEQSSAYIIYDMLLKIPVNDDTAAYTYTLYMDDSDEGITLEAPMEYRMYNELDRTYEVCQTAGLPEGKTEPQYQMYAIYSIASDKMLVNQINNPSGEGQISYIDDDTFKLSIAKPDNAQISNSELGDICFKNKLEVLIEAEFTDVPH
ncbi:MAG: hypothetical protein EOM54_10605 [Clostridia bacterium]|nr:hypothetical protein [Clostridia bacterium]